MPRRSSTWVDIRIHLFVIFAFSLVLMLYNIYVGAFGFILLALLFVYGRERCQDRERALEDYYNNVVKNINELSNYAIDNLPLAVSYTHLCCINRYGIKCDWIGNFYFFRDGYTLLDTLYCICHNWDRFCVIFFPQ